MSFIEVRVGGRFRLKRSLGQGSFGEIYIAENVQTNEEVAVKLEDTRTKYPQLIYEAKILYSLQGGSGIPNLIWCGQEGDYNVLIIELLGDSLETYFNLCNKRFSPKTVLMIVDQAIQHLEYIHYKGFLHRDIKPENFLVGLEKKCHLIHLIDYGLAKRYRDPKTGKHIPFKEGKQLTGTARYASLNTHQGLEQGRRDDMEALGYVFVYLYKGELPWQGLKSEPHQDKYTAIYQKKLNTSIKELCAGMPEEFVTYFEHCKKLGFDEKPDYAFLRRIFKELFLREGYEFDYVYDWMLIPLSMQLNMETDKVACDIEFSRHDEFMNYNICNLDKVPVDKKHEEVKTVKCLTTPPANQEQVEEKMPNLDKELGKESPITSDQKKPKPRPKPVETEYLRTDFKLGNIPTPVNLKSPSRSTLKKSVGKDCNLF